jgi:excisionase family DNA binding protein
MTAELLTVDQVADLLALSMARVRRLSRVGVIPHIALPGGELRFDRRDLLTWIQQQKRGPINNETKRAAAE